MTGAPTDPPDGNRIVFCDFDGTIADEETFVAVLYHFAPKLAAELVPGMQQRRITLREGVPPILESIPSARYPEILEWVTSLGVAGSRARLEPSGIPRSYLAQASGGKGRERLGHDGELILYLGRVAPQKGVQYAVEASLLGGVRVALGSWLLQADLADELRFFAGGARGGR